MPGTGLAWAFGALRRAGGAGEERGYKAMPRLTAQEIDHYLAGPHVAHLATIRADGGPHLAPVWYQWQEGKVLVVSGVGAVKTRNIRANPKVSLSVATDEWPYQYIILEGEAVVSSDNLREVVRSIFARYEGEERGQEEADELTRGAQEVVAIIIEVKRIMSWKGDE